jgi:hypothetical protein
MVAMLTDNFPVPSLWLILRTSTVITSAADGAYFGHTLPNLLTFLERIFSRFYVIVQIRSPFFFWHWWLLRVFLLLWDVTPCSLVYKHWRFNGTCCIYRLGRLINRPSNSDINCPFYPVPEHEASSHRKPASAGTSRYGYRNQGHGKRGVL